MEDAFGVIVVIICVIAAVAKSRKNPPQRRGGRPAGSFRSESAGQVFQQAFDRLSDKLEPAAKFIDDALTDENGMEVPSARRSAEVFMAKADGEEAAQNYDSSLGGSAGMSGSLGNPAATGGANRPARNAAPASWRRNTASSASAWCSTACARSSSATANPATSTTRWTKRDFPCSVSCPRMWTSFRAATAAGAFMPSSTRARLAPL